MSFIITSTIVFVLSASRAGSVDQTSFFCEKLQYITRNQPTRTSSRAKEIKLYFDMEPSLFHELNDPLIHSHESQNIVQETLSP
jgi:hypothetical protein